MTLIILQALLKEKAQEYARIKEEERQMKSLEEKLKASLSKEKAMLANKEIHKFQLRVSLRIHYALKKGFIISRMLKLSGKSKIN